MKLRPRNEQSEIVPGKADLHIHSDFSDGLSSLVSILDWVALKTDLNVISITDHDVLEGSRLAQTLARRYSYPFEVVPGVEVSTAEGHLLALYVSQPVPAGLSMEETIALVHEQNGLSILPHPFSRTGFIGRSMRYREASARVRDLQIDGVEVFNGAMLISTCNVHSPELARRLNKPALAGSDAHIRQAVGSCATLFPGRSATDLRVAIEQGEVMPAGRFWSPYAFVMTGVKWSLRRHNRLPVPHISVPAWGSQRRASVD